MKMFNTYKAGLLITLASHLLTQASLAQDISLASFGKHDYGDWQATGTAFQKGPASGELLATLEIENAPDSPVVSSEVEGDGPTGTLTSPEFKISRRYIAFRIGGGNYEFST